jgi:WD40 repeat protein
MLAASTLRLFVPGSASAQAERSVRKALAYEADLRKAAQLAEAERWPALRALLEEYRPTAGEPDLRGWEWHYLDCLARKAQVADRQELALQGPAEGIVHLAWSGDGGRLAAIGPDGGVVIWDTKAGKELARHATRGQLASFDRDGRRLMIVARDGAVSLLDVETGRSRQVLNGGGDGAAGSSVHPGFSPDGRLLALVTNQIVVLLDAATGGLLRPLAGDRTGVSAGEWDASGRMIAAGGDDGMIKTWDAATGELTSKWEADGPVVGLRWGADGRRIAAVIAPPRAEHQVRVWDVARRERVFAAEYRTYRTFPEPVPLVWVDGDRVAAEGPKGIIAWETVTARSIFRSPVFSNDARVGRCDPRVRQWATLEILGTKATCRVLNIDEREELLNVQLPFPGPRNRCALAWSPDGRRIAAGLARGLVYVHEVPVDRARVRSLNLGPARSFAWSPDGARFACSTSSDVRVGRLPLSGTPVRLGAEVALPVVVSLSPDGRSLVGADPDGSLPIWDVASGRVAQRLAGHPPQVERGRPDGRGASAMLWSPNGKRLASLRNIDGDLRVWDVEGARLLSAFEFAGDGLVARPDEALPLSLSRDGRYLAVSLTGGVKIQVFDVTAGTRVREWKTSTVSSGSAMAWDPAGPRLAACLMEPSPRLQIWDVGTGAVARSDVDWHMRAYGLIWSPDGRRLGIRNPRLHVYDLTSKSLVTLSGDGKYSTWKPDGSRLVLFGKEYVEFYDPATGRSIPSERRAIGPDPASLRSRTEGAPADVILDSVVWNERGLQAAGETIPDPGREMVVAWSVESGKPFFSLGPVGDSGELATGPPLALAWTHDGESLASIAARSRTDSRIDIWDAATGRRTQSFAGDAVGPKDAPGLAWSPDGRRLACAAREIRVYDRVLSGKSLALKASRKAQPQANKTFLSWSADGRNLAALQCRYASPEVTLTVWDMETGKERFSRSRPCEFHDMEAPVALSPDGRRLAWGGKNAAVWDVAKGQEAFPLSTQFGIPVEVAWSPDGRRVIGRNRIPTATEKVYELSVWDAETGKEVFLLRGPMAGWLVAPGFRGIASPPDFTVRSSPDVVVWDLGVRPSP